MVFNHSSPFLACNNIICFVYTGHSSASNDTLMDCLQTEEQVLAETDVKFLDLVQKASVHAFFVSSL
jgi:hypothetical protein